MPRPRRALASRTGCCRPTRAPARSRAGCTTRSASCRSSRRTATSTRGCCSTTSRSPTRRRCSSRPTTTSRGCCTPAASRSTRSASGRAELDRGGVARRRGGALCAHWHVFRGTPVRYWLEAELAEIFDVTLRPSAADGRRHLRPARRRGWPRTPTAPGRCSSGSASRCSPPPTTRATTWPRTPRSPPTPRGRAG